MISADLLYQIKTQYGSVFQTSLKNVEIIFRELTFAEFDKIAQHQKGEDFFATDVEELIIKCAVVFPEDLDVNVYPPGSITSLAEEILEESGFSSAKRAKQILQDKRNKAAEVRSLMKAFVLATISRYHPEDLDNMTFSKLAENVALAEKIIEIQQSVLGIEPTNVTLQLIDPEEEQEKEKDYADKFNAARKEGEAKLQDPIAHKLWGSG